MPNEQLEVQQTNDTPAPSPITEKPEENIIKRVADFKPTEAPASKPTPDHFDPNAWGNIESVDEAKNYAQSAYKSLEKGYQDKYRDIAELRKTLESQIKNEPQTWTPERVRQLMQDQNFVTSANDVLQNSQEDEYSSLSDKDKQEIARIKQENQLVMQNQSKLIREKEDTELVNKYPNYNPKAVDTITADLLANRVTNTREYIHKVLDYEPGIKRAYELGRQDERKQINVNTEGTSYDGGISTSTPSSPLKRDERESGESFFKRLYSASLKSTGGSAK